MAIQSLVRTWSSLQNVRNKKKPKTSVNLTNMRIHSSPPLSHATPAAATRQERGSWRNGEMAECGQVEFGGAGNARVSCRGPWSMHNYARVMVIRSVPFIILLDSGQRGCHLSCVCPKPGFEQKLLWIDGGVCRRRPNRGRIVVWTVISTYWIISWFGGLKLLCNDSKFNRVGIICTLSTIEHCTVCV